MTSASTEPQDGLVGIVGDPDAGELESEHGWRQRLVEVQSLWIISALAVMVVVFAVMRPGEFLTSFNVRNLGADAAVLLVLALGQTFVIVTAGIDLSVGSVLVFASVVGAEAMQGLGGLDAGTGAILVGVVVCVMTGAAWGCFNGFLIAKARIPPLIVTLGTLGMALGFAQIITDGLDVRDVPTALTATIGFGDVAGVPWIAIIALALAVVAGWLLSTTRFGQHTYAIGSNPEAARRVAIRVDRHLIRVYVLSGICAGIAAFLALAKLGTTTIGGHTTDNLAAITAVVLGGTSLFGGTGTIAGTVIGVFIPVVLANGLVILDVQAFWQGVAIGAVLILAVYWDQLRRRARERA
jgi:ribose transport system permease protein